MSTGAGRFWSRREWLLAAEGFARFAVLFALVRAGGWTKPGLGVLTMGCIVWCALSVWMEKLLWQEEQTFAALLKAGGRGVYLTVCLSAVWFFTAQISVFFYFCLRMVLHLWEMLCGRGAAWGSLVLLPVLTAVVGNSLLYLRSLCARLWRELHGAYTAWNLLWWAMALAAFAMAVGYRDEYCAAGFYLAYNWQLLMSFLGLLCVFFTVRKKYGKRDCGE
ncbi:MAG: hypothetical protein ACLVEV_07415 [Lachnospiraceae bacterium]|uniref:hypothetical protein n=1 Tax=Parablautia sp. Marseille-Q6255 TaxID=3039593 RepID=UPI0024BC81FA|nr:hypothetical protein [Parablautia sp. Marseille-Q6255]